MYLALFHAQFVPAFYANNVSIRITWPAEGIAQLTIDRDEKRNALSSSLLNSLISAFQHTLTSHPSAIVLTGAGSCFSAGADLSEGNPEDIYPALVKLIDLIRTTPIAVIAYVNGPAIGAGAMLAAACDIRVVSSSSFFAIPVARMGVKVDRQLAESMTALLGGSRSRMLLMTGARLSCADAVSCGFAAVEGDVEAAVEVARVCAFGDPETIASIKESFA